MTLDPPHFRDASRSRSLLLRPLQRLPRRPLRRVLRRALPGNFSDAEITLACLELLLVDLATGVSLPQDLVRFIAMTITVD